jgi:hypothetical protein
MTTKFSHLLPSSRWSKGNPASETELLRYYQNHNLSVHQALFRGPRINDFTAVTHLRGSHGSFASVAECAVA